MGALGGAFVLKSGLRILIRGTPSAIFGTPQNAQNDPTNFFVISLFLPSITHNLAMLWTVTGVSDNFLIF